MSNKFRILNFKNFDYQKLDFYQPEKTKDKQLLTTVSYRLTQQIQIFCTLKPHGLKRHLFIKKVTTTILI